MQNNNAETWMLSKHMKKSSTSFIVEKEMKDLIARIDNNEVPFSSDIVLKDYEIYLNLKKQMNRKKKFKIAQNKKW